jgi:prephenate dehydratase
MSKIAYLGPEFSYHYLATSLLPNDFDDYQKIPCQTFAEIFQQVELGNYGLIATRNKIIGYLKHNLKLIAEKNLDIEQRIKLPIQHCLLGLPNSSSDSIKTVYSHPVAISQCSFWLSGIDTVETNSTAEAGNIVIEHNI